MAVKKHTHLTYKSGKFCFGCSYDRETVLPLIAEGRARYKVVNGMPILPDLAAQLNEELVRRSIWGTAAIEGNPLGEDDVQGVLDGGAPGLAGRAREEISNLKNVYRMLEEPVKDDAPFLLTEASIKGIHAAITEGIDYYHNSPGRYRNEVVRVGDASHGGVYTPPKTLADVQHLMRLFVEWVNSADMLAENPLVRASMAHFHLGKIHPFQDGNGRTARLVEALLLHHAGIKYVPHELSNFYYRHLDDYFTAFSSAESGDQEEVTPFLLFFVNAFNASLDMIQRKMQFWVRKLTIKEYVYLSRRKKEITKRQQELLLVLLDTFKSFTLGDLYTDPVLRTLYSSVSESTARRDIHRLTALGLLVRKDGKNALNLKALG